MRWFKFPILLIALFIATSCNDKKGTTQSSKDLSTAIASSADVKAEKDKKEDLTKHGIALNSNNVLGGLKAGDTAPDFTMQDQNGNTTSLSASLKNGPVVMVFLRAEWCSFCVKHLQEFEENIKSIHEKGDAQVIAVSPQQKSYMKEFHEEHQLSYPILHDEDHSVMKDYKVFFHVTDKYNDYIEKAKGERIEVFNGNDEAVMPVPATYLIGQDGVIKYVHYDANYRKRSNVKELMLHL